jgi:hypothetical protein
MISEDVRHNVLLALVVMPSTKHRQLQRPATVATEP